MIKQSAASPHLLKHRGRALVFDSPEAYYAVVPTRTWTPTRTPCW